MRILSFLLLSFLIASSVTMAQGHNIYCNMADSTAATQNCLKKHVDAAQKRLNKVYEALDRHFEESDKKQQLKELQQTWLQYRDAECAWEIEQTDTKSLKRINELSCLARLTDDRADILGVVVMDEEAMGIVREYGSFPRWMNVLAKDNPAVYWNYGKRFARDLNCDDESEQIMTGIIAKEQDGLLTQDIVVAVAENSAIGRPKAKIFRFDINKEEAPESLCSASITLNAAHKKSDDGTCLSSLSVKHGACALKLIQWDGKAFILIEPETEEDTDTPNKK